MSYSRWSNSRWYTFHTSFSGDTKESQAFEVMIDFARSKVFTYGELINDIDLYVFEIENLCASSVTYSSPSVILTEDFKNSEENLFDRIVYVEEIAEPDPATDEELRELKVYMENFIADVKWDYSICGKFSDYLIGTKHEIISKFGWWIKHKMQPKRKKYIKHGK